MARPIKHGLDYFPLDVDFFSDEKMYAISGEFGIKGEITTIKLLCAVYRNGYYIEWTEMMKFKLLKELPGVSADLLEQVIKRLVKWGFFDKNLFDSAQILTSKGIQRRFQTICTKMHRKNAITVYRLIDEVTPTAPKNIPSQKHKPQKAVSKPTPPMASAPAPVFKQRRAPVALDDSIAAMMSDTVWNEPVCMRYKLTPEQFKQKVANFKFHCLSQEKRQHEDVTDAKRHFCNLLSQGKLNDVSPTIADDTPTDYTYSGGFGSKDT